MAKKLNPEEYIGKKYGRLTILEYAGRDSRSFILMRCKCECGGETLSRLADLKNGKAKTCGCSRRRIFESEEIGKKYGRLTVLEIVGKNKRNEKIAKCKCDCGNIVDVSMILLRRGTTNSCGCIRRTLDGKDYVGKKYGKLTILESLGRDGSRVLVKCKCDCGNEKIIDVGDIKSGRTKSCGCGRKGINVKFYEKDLIGQRFGRLTITKMLSRDEKSNVIVECKCDCGNIITRKYVLLQQGHTKSCGCLFKEHCVVHGRYRDNKRLYSEYKGMISRCYNPKNCSYDRYGAVGIDVSVEWLNDYESFKNWSLENGYTDDLTIDRIDNTKGYSADNCRWVNSHIQNANQGLSTRNTSGYRGLSYNVKRKVYDTCLTYNNKRIYLGSYKNKKEALDARNKYILDNNLTEYPIQEWREEDE